MAKKNKGMNPALLGLLGMTLGPALWQNRDAIKGFAGDKLGGAMDWIKGLFGKGDKQGDLSQMPFGSDDRIAEYEKRNWAPDDTLMAPTTSAGDLSQMPFGSQERIDEYNKRNWAMDDTTLIPGGTSQEVGERYPVSDEVLPDYSGESVEVSGIDSATNLPVNNPKTSGNDALKGSGILAGGYTPDAPGINIPNLFSASHWKRDTVPGQWTDRWFADKLGFDVYNNPHGAAPSSDLSNTFIGAPIDQTPVFDMTQTSHLGTDDKPGMTDFFDEEDGLTGYQNQHLLGGGETTWPGQKTEQAGYGGLGPYLSAVDFGKGAGEEDLLSRRRMDENLNRLRNRNRGY